jgi:diguanylate cyclase (GGDEF)-like protein/PAS domain S-box-containing protein
LLRRKNNDIKKSSQELKALTANIPGCVKRCKYDSNLTMIYCSDGFLQLTGYTRDEVRELFEDKYINMIYRPDREKVRFNIDKQLQSGEVIDIQYRLLKKDGALVWICDKGQLMIEVSMEPEFYSVLIDVTYLKETIQELEISNERYQIVMDQSDSAIFEYNILNDVVSIGRNSQNLSGGSFKDFLKNFGRILYMDDMDSFEAMFTNVRAGAHSAEGEYRLKNTKSSYLWYDINITTIFDKDNRPVRAIGTISDITCQKEATQTLMEKAERDALTGLLNKSTTKSFIEEALKCDSLCALYMIDVDYFKNVNDSLGHLFGDTVLAGIGDKLKKLFRTSDVVGRIGGDEFMVLLKNISDTSLITEKAEAINRCLNQTFGSGADRCTISGSVGIALYPEDSKTYADLYKKADIALYQAKRAGRNRYIIFSNAESLQLESCDECHNTLTPTLDAEENPPVNPQED